MRIKRNLLEETVPKGGGEPVTPEARSLFLAMLEERERIGIERYGRSLHTNNGRDALKDAMEEAADLWQYLTQIRIERAREYEEGYRLRLALHAANVRLRAYERKFGPLAAEKSHDDADDDADDISEEFF